MENDTATRQMLDNLEMYITRDEDPFFVTKQLLKGNVCDNCWRLEMLKDGTYTCGSPQLRPEIRRSNDIRNYSPLPEIRTCIFHVRRREKIDNP